MIEKRWVSSFKTPPRVETRSKEQVRQYIVNRVSDSQSVASSRPKSSLQETWLDSDTLKLQSFLESLPWSR